VSDSWRRLMQSIFYFTMEFQSGFVVISRGRKFDCVVGFGLDMSDTSKGACEMCFSTDIAVS